MKLYTKPWYKFVEIPFPLIKAKFIKLILKLKKMPIPGGEEGGSVVPKYII